MGSRGAYRHLESSHGSYRHRPIGNVGAHTRSSRSFQQSRSRGSPERPHRRVALARPGLDVQIPAQDRAPHVQVPEVLDGLADEIANFLHLKRSRPRAVAPIVRLSVNVEQDEAPRPGPDAKADALDLALDVRVFAEPDGGGGNALPERPRLHALRRLELVKAVFEAGCGSERARGVRFCKLCRPARGRAGTCRGACIEARSARAGARPPAARRHRAKARAE